MTNANIGKVTIADNAEAARIIIDADSTVNNVEANAPNAEFNVAGTVNNVSTSAANTTITGTGTVTRVEVKTGADGTKVETPKTKITVDAGVSGVTAGGGQAVEGGSTAENNEDGTGIETPPPAGGGTYTPPPSTVAVTNVTLPETRLYLDLETNTTATLTATVLPANETNKNVTWTSSHPQFATVDENGVVTVVAQGTTTITVTTVDGNKTASVIVEVHPNEDVAIIQAACDAIQEGDYTNLEVSDLSNQDQKNAAVLAVADTLKGSTTVEIMFSENKYWVTSTYNLFNLTVEVVPTFVLTQEALNAEPAKYEGTATIASDVLVDADITSTIVRLLGGQTAGSGITLSYAVSPGDYLKVEGGAIKLKAQKTTAGNATETVTVTFTNGSRTSAKNVTVTIQTSYVSVTGVTLNQDTLNLTAGGATATLVATVAPANATNQAVTWTSSDESVATVVNGVVTPLSAGTTTITVTTVDGSFTDTCEVSVQLPAQSGAPVFTGGTPATYGTQLTVGAGTLGVTTNLTYKWYRSDDANYDEGTDTLRTTGTSYTPVAEDIGKYLIVVVTTPDASGSGIVATLATVGTEITDYTRFPNVTLDADEHITDLEALRASGKLPITVTVTDGTHSVEANIGNWYNIAELDEFDGTTPGTYTLRATWAPPLGWTLADPQPFTVEITVVVNVAQTSEYEITGYNALPGINLMSDEHLTDLAALKASGRLPDTVTLRAGLATVEAEITDWTGTYDGTAQNAYTLTAVWTLPDGYTDTVDPITVELTVIVNVVQTPGP